MKIVKQWIVNQNRLLVELENGDFMIGGNLNVSGYAKISQSDAYALINS